MVEYECPSCESSDVEAKWGTVKDPVVACRCRACGHRWDEYKRNRKVNSDDRRAEPEKA